MFIAKSGSGLIIRIRLSVDSIKYFAVSSIINAYSALLDVNERCLVDTSSPCKLSLRYTLSRSRRMNLRPILNHEIPPMTNVVSHHERYTMTINVSQYFFEQS